MALTKEVKTDKYEIVGEFKHVQIREATVIFDDGVEISRAFNRKVIAPSDKITNESAETKAIVGAVHTKAVKDAYKLHLENTV